MSPPAAAAPPAPPALVPGASTSPPRPEPRAPRTPGGHLVDELTVVEDGELALGLDRHDPVLDDAALAEDPPVRHLGDPSLEDRFHAGEGRAPVAQGEAHRRPGGADDGVGRRQDDVERGRQHGAVHASGRSFVGHVEDGASQGLGRLEVEHDRQGQRVEGADHDVEGHGPPDRHLSGRRILVRRDETRERHLGRVRLELVRHPRQLRRQPSRLRGRRRGADREADEAAQDVGQLLCLGQPALQPRMELEGRGQGVGGRHGANSTAVPPPADIPGRTHAAARPFPGERS